MDRNEWYRAGEEIRDQVQQAVDTGNFTNLGKNIGDTVNETINRTMQEVNRTMGTVGESVNRTVGAVGEGVNRVVNNVGNGISRAAGGLGGGNAGNTYMQRQTPYAHLPQYRKPNTRPDTRLFQRTPKGSVSGVVGMCVGYSVAGLGALAVLGAIVDSAGVASLVASGLFIAAGLGIGIRGTRVTGRAERYKRYVEMVKDRLYCPIREIADKTGKSERFIISDIKKMLQLGMFKQGRLDEKETCLIARRPCLNITSCSIFCSSS